MIDDEAAEILRDFGDGSKNMVYLDLMQSCNAQKEVIQTILEQEHYQHG